MRIVALAFLLALALPVRAQRAADVPGRQAPVALSETPSVLGLDRLFNAQTLDISHSVEASVGGGYGGTVGLGMYTTTLRWQPSARLAGRVDVSAARSFGSSPYLSGLGEEQTQVFLRNAELAYRPTDNAVIHLRVSQSPYGAYASPYGSPYGLSPRYRGLGFESGEHLFFRDGQ